MLLFGRGGVVVDWLLYKPLLLQRDQDWRSARKGKHGQRMTVREGFCKQPFRENFKKKRINFFHTYHAPFDALLSTLKGSPAIRISENKSLEVLLVNFAL